MLCEPESLRLYSCSLLELFPDSDPEPETLGFGDGRDLCEREEDSGDLCMTNLLSIMAKSSITCDI